MLIQYLLQSYRNKCFTGEMKFKDLKIESINEMISSIKVIKFYSFEKAFQDKINRFREKEVHFIKVFTKMI